MDRILKAVLYSAILAFVFSCTHFYHIDKPILYSGEGELRLYPGNFYQINRSGFYRPFNHYDTGQVEIKKNRIYFNSFNKIPRFYSDTALDIYTYSPYSPNYVPDTTELLLHNSRIGHTIYNINVLRNDTLVYHIDSLRKGQKIYLNIVNRGKTNKGSISVSMNKLCRSFKFEKEIKLRFYMDTIRVDEKIISEGKISKNKISSSQSNIQLFWHRTRWH